MGRKIRVIFLLVCFFLASSSAVLAEKRQTRMKEASAVNASSGIFEKTESVERTQIDIEEASTYVSHAINIISATPKDAAAGKWTVSDGVIKGADGRTESVWVEVRAKNKDFFGEPVFIRAQLVVVVMIPD